MKTKILLVAGVLGVVGFGSVMAGDTNTLTVTATVVGTCKFNSATSSLAFGSLDPSSASDASATGSTTYWCTKGTVASTTADNGSNYSGTSRRMSNGAATPEYIPYSLTLAGGTQTGAGKGTPLTLGLSGGILNADYINVSAGAYTDTVTLTVTP